MNWKWMVAVMFGLALGIVIAPFEHKTVLASAVPVNAHFQMQDATVDEPNGLGQDTPVHEVFLLDTESGSVWKFQGIVWVHDKDGQDKMFSEPKFIRIAVEPKK